MKHLKCFFPLKRHEHKCSIHMKDELMTVEYQGHFQLEKAQILIMTDFEVIRFYMQKVNFTVVVVQNTF